MTWVSLPKYSEAYSNGVTDFVQNAFDNFATGSELRCPCKDCSNRFWFSEEDVYDHLVSNGLCPLFVNWVYEVSTPKFKKVDQEMDCDSGMGPGEDFDKMIRDERFIVKLYLLKCTHGFTEGAFSGILKLIKKAFPDINLPSSFNVSKNMIRELGLDYQKIHACPNDWLQRLFMCKDYSKLMTLHALERTKDGKLRYPADVEGWKSMDANHPNFVADPRNLRLGLAADGINPYRSMNISHNTWPIILVNYNLPPWLIMKPDNLILSTLVPGPVYPGNDIDVYMQPLIAELKELWEIGLETYDAYADETFMLRSSLLWTISDFLGYAILSGWSTKGTLLNMGGKTKDHITDRKDLQEMGIRKVLHPIKIEDSNRYEIRAATFNMTKKEKESFCTLFMDAKLPHGTASNISRCVNVAERKIFGYKSHDAQFILQYLLQFTAVKNLKPEVAIPLVRLGAFFRGICGKVLELEEVHKLQEEVIEILCQLEINFPPAFFDIMVHLPVHLYKEVEFGGSVHLRWMFGIERYLEIEKNINVGYPIGSRRNKDGKFVYLAEHVLINAHRYVLFNSGNVKIEKLIEYVLIPFICSSKDEEKERTHTLEFHNWLKAKVEKRTENTLELSNLARGPQRATKKFSGYVINGFRFHTRKRDTNCTTQNIGVILTALTTSFASSKNQNPTVGDVIYYGAIEEIIKVFYIQDCTEKKLWFVVNKLPKEHNGIDEETDDVLEDLCGPTMHDAELEYPFQNQTDDMTWHRDDIPNENVSSGEEEEDHDDDHDE
ncbi:uncharacterized protein LOC141690996 [Apium graveolens]|uniref:uncharacterized protein LOC141690996 n=1 Tax=Apium graveolens TaxID=4045 RepID=UPI003D7958A7